MRRARSKPVTGGAAHFDAGRPALVPLPADEFHARYIEPAEDDPDADAAVVAWLARLLRRPVER